MSFWSSSSPILAAKDALATRSSPLYLRRAPRLHRISTSRPRLLATDYPRRSRGAAATSPHEVSASQPRRRFSPRTIHVPAAASLLSTDYPRPNRGAAAIRQGHVRAAKVRHETVLRERIVEARQRVEADLLLLLRKVRAAHDTDSDRLAKLEHEFSHLRRHLEASRRERAVYIKKRECPLGGCHDGLSRLRGGRAVAGATGRPGGVAVSRCAFAAALRRVTAEAAPKPTRF